MTWNPRAISAGPYIALHVIYRSLNPRLLRQVAPYDVASIICQALPLPLHGAAPPVVLNPRFFSQVALYDVAHVPGPSQRWRFSFLDAILERFPPPVATALSPDFLIAADEVWRKVSNEVRHGGPPLVYLSARPEPCLSLKPYNHPA